MRTPGLELHDVVVFVVALTVFLVSPVRELMDSNYTVLLSERLLYRQALDFDPASIPRGKDAGAVGDFADYPYQVRVIDGRLYYRYPVATAVLSAPFVAVANLLGIAATAADRIVIPLDESFGYVRRLRAILTANGVLTIAGEHSGQRNVTLPFLGEDTAFATGAVSLARATGAALLSVRAERTAPGAYAIVIEPAIAIPPDRTEGAAIVMGELVGRLERAVRAHPADWEPWSTIDPAQKQP